MGGRRPGFRSSFRIQAGPGDGEPVTFDLAKLAAIEAPERELLRRYIGMIQVQRGDFNGRVITVRNEDVRSLARVFERDEAGMRRRFDELGSTPKPTPRGGFNLDTPIGRG